MRYCGHTCVCCKFSGFDIGYNSYSISKIYNMQQIHDNLDNLDSNVDYSDVNAICKCNVCGFECLAFNYMNS